jgi:hypothetical protein
MTAIIDTSHDDPKRTSFFITQPEQAADQCGQLLCRGCMTCPESRGNALPCRAKGRYDQYADISYPFRNWCAAAASWQSQQDFCQLYSVQIEPLTDVCLLSVGRMNTGLKGEDRPCVICGHLRGSRLKTA